MCSRYPETGGWERQDRGSPVVGWRWVFTAGQARAMSLAPNSIFLQLPPVLVRCETPGRRRQWRALMWGRARRCEGLTATDICDALPFPTSTPASFILESGKSKKAGCAAGGVRSGPCIGTAEVGAGRALWRRGSGKKSFSRTCCLAERSGWGIWSAGECELAVGSAVGRRGDVCWDGRQPVRLVGWDGRLGRCAADTRLFRIRQGDGVAE
jgi:hypothetical protein